MLQSSGCGLVGKTLGQSCGDFREILKIIGSSHWITSNYTSKFGYNIFIKIFYS